jgi:hypothetical protein
MGELNIYLVMSIYIFILVMEAFSGILDNAIIEDMFNDENQLEQNAEK